MRRIQVLGVVAIGVTGVFLGLQAAEGPDRDVQPTGKGIGTLQHPPMPEQANGSPGAKAGGAKPSTNGISYHGGPVMLNPVNMYYIWYGDWTGNTATSILADLATNIGNSAYYNINRTYTNGSGEHVSTVFNGATVSTTYPYGKSLSDTQIRQVVQDTITSGQ